ACRRMRFRHGGPGIPADAVPARRSRHAGGCGPGMVAYGRRTGGLESPDVTENQARLLLVDGHSLAYRAFFALREANLVTRTGQHTEAVYGFTSMLINVIRD